MSDAPALIGRHRIGPTDRAAGLGSATPVSLRQPGWNDKSDEHVPKTAEELRADREASRDAQPLVTLCGLCDWRYEGTAGDGREAARLHREQHHPEAAKPRARRGRRSGWVKPDTEQSRLDADEARRVRAEREDAERLAKIERGRQRDALAAMDDGERQALAPVLEETTTDLGPVAVSSSNGKRGRRWTRGEILDAIRDHAARTGQPPTAVGWRSGGDHPSTGCVQRIFRSWADAIEAAGFERPVRGRRYTKPSSGRAERLAPATRQGNTAARPAEPEREPQAEDAGHDPAILARTVSPPVVSATEAASRSDLLTDVRRYLQLRREVDRLEAELLAALDQELAA